MPFCFGYDNDVTFTDFFHCNIRFSGNTATIINTDTPRYFVLFKIPQYYGYSYNVSYSNPDTVPDPVFVRFISFDDDDIRVGSVGQVVASMTIQPGETLSFDYFLDVNSNYYVVLSVNGYGPYVNNLSITTDFSYNGLTGAVNDLVEYVGVRSFWDTFSSSISYISVVIVVVFGFYLVFRMIKGLSKGKSKL